MTGRLVRIPTYSGEKPEDEPDPTAFLPYVAITWHQNRKGQHQLILRDGSEEVATGGREVAQALADYWGWVQEPPEPDEDHIARWERPERSP